MISANDITIFEKNRRLIYYGYDFLYLLPHHSLREYIANYDIITYPAKYNMLDSHVIMPHGDAIMPHTGVLLSIETNMKNISVTIYGPTTRPSRVSNNPSGKLVVIVNFHPTGFFTLTGINQKEFVDKQIPFVAVSPILCKLISDAFEKAKNVNEIVTSLDNLLMANMHMACRPELLQTLRNITNCGGDITVKKLSDDINYSERQLNRIFSQYVGISVKSFSRLVRVDNIIQMLENSKCTITSISDTLEFCDLPYFINDFKLLCGITPLEYRNNMSDFHNAIIYPLK